MEGGVKRWVHRECPIGTGGGEWLRVNVSAGGVVRSVESIIFIKVIKVKVVVTILYHIARKFGKSGKRKIFGDFNLQPSVKPRG